MKEYVQLKKEFIQKEFITAPPVYSVIYLYLLSKADNSVVKVDLSKVEDEINVSISEIFNCLKYFDRKKLLTVKTELSGETIISFEEDLVCNIEDYSVKKDYAEVVEIKENDIVENKELKLNKKQYSNKELTLVKLENEEISELFNYVEEVTGTLLSNKDLSIVYSFYSYYNLPIDVIFFMVAYCINNNKRNLKYMEEVAKSWSESDIKTLDEAEKYLTNYNKEYKEILSALGVKSGIVDANKEIMDRWLIEHKISIDLIIEACKRTVVQTGTSSLNYADTILMGWKKDNIKTLEEVKKSDETFKANKKNEKATKPKENYINKKPKFTDYQQRNLDFDKLQQQAMQKKLNKGL